MTRFYRWLGLPALLLAGLAGARPAPGRPGAPSSASTFSFVALGDMPYSLPADYGRFEKLIGAINQQRPTFSVHVGDIKSGSTLCTEEMYGKVLTEFKTFEQPLVYTPGDNEWTDCNRPKAGSYDPEERLAVVRKMFFADHNSFGKTKLALTSQALDPAFAAYVENNRWTAGNVAFATVHLVGSNNNFVPNDAKGQNREFYERQRANLAWLDAVFAEATAQKRLGVVLFTQADMFNPAKDAKDADGFSEILGALTRHAVAFGRPVLLVNGDSHRLILDKPLLNPASPKQVLQNFTRLQVPGEADVQAVRITVDPGQPALFSVQELVVLGN
ncbi:metallophosphoesterase [Hymenobacter sp. PAMC 26628]|uniref:metallophosphoesterase n=1 Tax=Hymenobacter sp. PAMC 26628 TaxID=1484118 RepID=UPI00195152FD|nr:metallophosphoesterase [Hymenobacter sp. PAMC 26628]